LLRAALGSGQANVDNNLRTTSLLGIPLTLLAQQGRSDFTISADFTGQESEAQHEQRAGHRLHERFCSVTGGSTSRDDHRGSSRQRDRLLSYLGRLNLRVRRQVSADHDFRADGASEVAENTSGPLPVVGAGRGRVSDEDFMKRVPAVSELKLRGNGAAPAARRISSYQSLAA